MKFKHSLPQYYELGVIYLELLVVQNIQTIFMLVLEKLVIQILLTYKNQFSKLLEFI